MAASKDIMTKKRVLAIAMLWGEDEIIGARRTKQKKWLKECLAALEFLKEWKEELSAN